MIVKMLVVGPYMSNCYVVGSEKTKEGMIVDPGADSDIILKTVADLGLNIKLIVATHSHLDHIGALKSVMAKTQAPFAMHESESNNRMIEEISKGLSSMMGLTYDKPPTPNRLLKDGDIIELGELRFNVLHVPGHSPGGIVLEGQGIAISGDTLFQYSIGRTDFPGGSHSDLMNGIFDKLMALPDETIVYSGHGPHTTIGVERKHNPFVREWASHRR